MILIDILPKEVLLLIDKIRRGGVEKDSRNGWECLRREGAKLNHMEGGSFTMPNFEVI